jgi:putative CocE/NonD family hydrolase
MLRGGLGHAEAKIRDHMVAMRDGVRLATDVYLPESGGPFPVILIRTPYGKAAGNGLIQKVFAASGYAVVAQDVRGRYESEGQWEPFIHEGPDGADTIDWVRKQNWCNGKIGLFGVSYFGYTQWQAATAAGNEVQAMTPTVTGSRIYDLLYHQGVFSLLLGAGWGFANAGHRSGGEFGFHPGHDFAPPLVDLDRRSGHDVPFFNTWLQHPTFDKYWMPASSEGRWENVNAPALLVGGWYDLFQASTLDDWEKISTKAGRRAQRESRLVMGPWAHNFSHKLKGVDFGRSADYLEFAKTYGEWFRHYLQGAGDIELPRVRVFTTGIDRWQNLGDWPPPSARVERWNLHSGGQAHGGGDGELSAARPGREPNDRFVHDPNNLVPTLGGTVFPPEMAGPGEVSQLSRRNDVMVYNSKPMSDDFEITGPLEAQIWITADTPDADVAVTLADVSPDGEARLLVDGIARARYRNGGTTDWLDDNKPEAIKVKLGGISHVVEKGHRLRVLVAASNYPRYAPNPCTKDDPATARQFRRAEIHVYHDGDHPSWVALSVRERR